MDHHMPIGIQASPLQLRKLVKGMKVRLKQGTGFCLLVHPEKYHLMSRTFGKDKGIDVSLTEQELHANANASMSGMTGSGIFGKKADKFFEKKGIKKAVYQVGSALKPIAKDLLDQGGKMANAYGVPVQVTDPLVQLGNDYMDDPESLQGKKGRRELKNRGLDFLQSGMDEMGRAYGTEAPNVRDYEKMVQDYRQGKSAPSSTSGLTTKGMKNMADQYAKQHAYDYLNEQLGTNTGYNLNSGLGQAELGSMAGQHIADQISRRFTAPPMGQQDEIAGLGFRHHGSGFGLMGHLRRREIGSISGRGSVIPHSGPYGSPAMVSQPFGANLQMKVFLPPQYQQYFEPAYDHGHGMGLYAGKGLY
jgi:hypothetical protein